MMNDQKSRSSTFFLSANPASPVLKTELEQLGHSVFFCDAQQQISSTQSFSGNAHMIDSDVLVYWAPLPKADQLLEGMSASAYVSREMTPLFEACQEFTKAMMRKRKSASIVTIVDFSAKSGFVNYAIHSALTAGIVGFSKCLALELSKNNIRVNTICTGLIEEWIPQDILEESVLKYLQSLNLGRSITLKSLANTLSHMMSPEHSMTGAIVQIDNGCVI